MFLAPENLKQPKFELANLSHTYAREIQFIPTTQPRPAFHLGTELALPFIESMNELRKCRVKFSIGSQIKLAVCGIFAVFAMIGLGACGSNSGSSNPTAALACPVGSNQSASYGCLPQSTCPAGQGLYNGGCIGLTTQAASSTCTTAGYFQTAYGCQPQGTCPAGSATYNGGCVPVTTTAGTCPAGYTMYNGICSAATSAASTSCSGYCGAGNVQTSYGCLPQSNCYACFGYSSGYCVAPTGYSYYLGY